ncbi:hypothetical protein T5B8_02000 [Salinisphaera sp. T5B8]|uniref:hypothetical protein n=1 Tax=Salinisphaera sp. T5B8 TaxID=1304154 RepID=UPI00334189A6
MLKKILIACGVFFIALLVIYAGLFIWAFRQSYVVAEDVTPYVEGVLPELTTWQYASFEQELTPTLREQLETTNGEKVLRQFATLGALESHEPLQVIRAERGFNLSAGRYNRAIVLIPAHFEAGDAQIQLTLDKVTNGYVINGIHISSVVFLE